MKFEVPGSSSAGGMSMTYLLLLVNSDAEATTAPSHNRELREFPGGEGLSFHFRPVSNDLLWVSQKLPALSPLESYAAKESSARSCGSKAWAPRRELPSIPLAIYLWVTAAARFSRSIPAGKFSYLPRWSRPSRRTI